jgi:hypothetical protein
MEKAWSLEKVVQIGKLRECCIYDRIRFVYFSTILGTKYAAYCKNIPSRMGACRCILEAA